ncbi:ATP-dependent DNA helicase Q5 isoform X2 [Halictus rubicundus]|uniref:ATP-dependent DNA helicase Q5 isoform X2 n=1 Tax=Halictus rubicundus TaxID=77578 RepID=UPI004037325D
MIFNSMKRDVSYATKNLIMNDDESRVTSGLRTVFNHENFKNEVQKDATIAISKGSKYVCISLPPGFGRSVCYELPAVLQKGKIVIVFSPKLCFMKSRVDFLRNKQINARLLSISTRMNERKVILKDLTSNCLTIQLLYATPDVAIMPYFQKLVVSLKERRLLYYIVFNEAHCLSEWGYEYIPCYKNINLLDKIYENIPRVAVTTTVTHEVIEDICQLLTLRTPSIFKVPVQQMNVYYDVLFVDILSHPFEHLQRFIIEVLGFLDPPFDKTHNGFAIVYCKEEDTAESLKSNLISAGISTLVCHHKLNNRSRRNIESQWISGKASVIVTTYDYGFIHRKLIKCKVYWTVPENIPKYYRESVQSLKANHRTYSRIYFSSQEYSSTKMLIENHRVMNGLEHIKKRLSEYKKLVAYCLSVKCRHAVISEYFGDVADPCKVNCDVCENRDIVKARAVKFIAYCENVVRIKYDICDISEDTEAEQSQSVKEKSPECAVKGVKKCSAARGAISVDKNNSGAIVQCRDKQYSSSACTRSSTKDYVRPCSASTVKRAKDNSNATGASKPAITDSLLVKYNLNNEISLEPCGSKNNAAKTSARVNGTRVSSGRRNVSRTKSRIEGANSNAGTRTVEKEDRVTRNDSCELIFVGSKGRSEERNKRCTSIDTHPAEFSSKRRKFETENKPTAVTRDRRGNRTSDRDERVKDDANEIVSRDHATAEYLMNKYKLNKDSITLKPCRK